MVSQPIFRLKRQHCSALKAYVCAASSASGCSSVCRWSERHTQQHWVCFASTRLRAMLLRCGYFIQSTLDTSRPLISHCGGHGSARSGLMESWGGKSCRYMWQWGGIHGGINVLWRDTRFHPWTHHFVECGSSSDIQLTSFEHLDETTTAKIRGFFNIIHNESTAGYHMNAKWELCSQGCLVRTLIYEATSLGRKLRWATASTLTTCCNI